MAHIIIVANFCGQESIKNRFVNIAQLLHENGHHVQLITSDFSHGTKTHKDFPIPNYNFKITRIHEPGYKSNVSPLRLFSHKVWGNNVFKYVKSLQEKPDLIYSAIPSLTQAKLLGKYANKYNIKFVTDIQDLWPEAFELLLKNKLLQKFIFSSFHKYANMAYKYADFVIGVSDTYTKRGTLPLIVGKHNLHHAYCKTIYLGNNIKLFDEHAKLPPKKKFNNEFRIGYIGTLGYSYDIKCVIDALVYVKKQYGIDNINFMVMGDGPLRNGFEKYAKDKSVKATFTGGLSYPEMVTNLCSCDIVVNPIVKGGAQSITNKVGDYAFSGIPVVNSQPNDEYRQLIEKFKCGINCEVENSEEMGEAIYKLYNDPKLRKQMGVNGRCLGEERFDRNRTYPIIISVIESLLK